jgi:hypothetical protein
MKQAYISPYSSRYPVSSQCSSRLSPSIGDIQHALPSNCLDTSLIPPPETNGGVSQHRPRFREGAPRRFVTPPVASSPCSRLVVLPQARRGDLGSRYAGQSSPQVKRPREPDESTCRGLRLAVSRHGAFVRGHTGRRQWHPPCGRRRTCICSPRARRASQSRYPRRTPISFATRFSICACGPGGWASLIRLELCTHPRRWLSPIEISQAA